MAESPSRTETRTDVQGSYTVYVYSDGHEETDPAGRPVSLEDLQRKRLAEHATTNALSAVESAVAGAAGTSDASIRQNRPAATLRALTAPFHVGLELAQMVPRTMGITRAQREDMLSSFDLGGPVVGDNAGAGVEYV